MTLLVTMSLTVVGHLIEPFRALTVRNGRLMERIQGRIEGTEVETTTEMIH